MNNDLTVLQGEKKNMFRNVFFVDITEHRGLEQSVVSSVQAYASEYNPEHMEWFKLPHHVRPDLGNGGQVFSGLETGLQLWPQIRQRILDLSGDGYAGSVFHVLSYDPLILSEARKLNRPDLIVRTGPLAVLLTKWRMSQPSYGRTLVYRPQVSSPALPIHDAMELTKRVLKKYGHTSQQTALLQVQLRPLLTREDPRAKKNPQDRNSSRLVASIVAEGMRTGSLGQYSIDNIPGTERIWLIEGSPLQEAQQIVIAQHGTAEVVRVLEEPGQQQSSQAMKQAEVEETSLVEVVNHRTEARLRDKGRPRTDQIVKALRDEGVFTPKPQRNMLFKALRECLIGDQAKTLLALRRDIRATAEGADVKAGGHFPFWHPAVEGMVGMLLGARVLRDEQKMPVSRGLFANSLRILSFEEPLEDRCEAFLLLTAISKLKDIRRCDRIPLAHALFWEDSNRSTRDSVEERFEQVFGLLVDRIDESAEGVWYVKPGPSAGGMAS